MKKRYIIPAFSTMMMDMQQIIALSIKGTADDSEVLVKDNDWNIWGNDADIEVEE